MIHYTNGNPTVLNKTEVIHTVLPNIIEYVMQNDLTKAKMSKSLPEILHKGLCIFRNMINWIYW